MNSLLKQKTQFSLDFQNFLEKFKSKIQTGVKGYVPVKIHQSPNQDTEFVDFEGECPKNEIFQDFEQENNQYKDVKTPFDDFLGEDPSPRLEDAFGDVETKVKVTQELNQQPE